jgi:hypothetical protein
MDAFLGEVLLLDSSWGVCRIDMITLTASTNALELQSSAEIGMIYDGTETFCPILAAPLYAPADPGETFLNKNTVQLANPFYCSNVSFWMRGETSLGGVSASCLIALSTSVRQQETP